MPTNLAIDDRLLEEAQRVGRRRTKRETVTVTLQEYMEDRKQQEILSLFGDIDHERGYDYKRERKASDPDFSSYARVLPLRIHTPCELRQS